MELLVAAGLTPKAALLAGTSNSALALGLAADRGTIEKGKRADLVLIDGKPWETIGDVEKIDRVYVDGKLVHGGGVKLPAGNLATTLPAVPAAALIDDFERADGRSSLDTLRLTDMDGGVERSAVVSNRVTHAGGDGRSEEHTSELQSLMRISYAVFCLKKKNHPHLTQNHDLNIDH